MESIPINSSLTFDDLSFKCPPSQKYKESSSEMEFVIPPIACDLKIPSSSKIEYSDIPCIKCQGTGRNLQRNPCRKCDGSGKMKNDRKLKVMEYLIEQKLQALTKEIENLKWKEPTSSEKDDLNKMLSIQINRDIPVENQYVHNNFKCNGCSILPIIGIRFHCIQCADVDYCDSCEKIMGPIHLHPLLKIKSKFDQKNYIFPYQNNNDGNDYRATIEFLNYKPNDAGCYVVEAERNDVFRIEIKIKNKGEQKWPNGVELKCISGVFDKIDEGIPSLEPGEDCQVTNFFRSIVLIKNN